MSKINAALNIAAGYLDTAEEDQSSGEADGTYERDPEIWKRFEEHRHALAEARAEADHQNELTTAAIALLKTAGEIMTQLVGILLRDGGAPA